VKKKAVRLEKGKEDQWVKMNCRNCPRPSWKDKGWCSLCATLCKDKDGNLYIAIKPIKEVLDAARR